FSVFERFGRLEIHLRGIGLRYLQLTTKFRVVHCRFSRMVTIRHNDVIDWAVTEDHGTRLACHRRRIDENLMFPNREKEPIEIELLLLREPGPLPDAGKQILHCVSRLRLSLSSRISLNLSLGLNLSKERQRHPSRFSSP